MIGGEILAKNRLIFSNCLENYNNFRKFIQETNF